MAGHAPLRWRLFALFLSNLVQGSSPLAIETVRPSLIAANKGMAVDDAVLPSAAYHPVLPMRAQRLEGPRSDARLTSSSRSSSPHPIISLGGRSLLWAVAGAAALAATTVGPQRRSLGAQGTAVRVEPPDVMDEVPPLPNEEPTFLLWRLLDRWHKTLPALRPSYEDRLYIRQRRVNPDIEPGPFTWLRLRHVVAAGVVAAVGLWLLNGSVYFFLSHIHRSYPLGQLQQERVSEGFQRAAAIVHYAQIMGRLSDDSAEAIAAQVKALTAQYELVEQASMVWVLTHRIADVLFAAAVALLAAAHRTSLKPIWNQVRLILRLNFRTPFRAVVLLFFSDVFLGFHSNELWILFLSYLGERYGLKVGSGHWINIVKGIVPVCVDVLFKFTVFFFMQRKTQIIMREMNEM